MTINGMTEILIYALANGDTERYTEQLISTQCKTENDIKKVTLIAKLDGWHSFRIGYFEPGTVPNFIATLTTNA